MKLIQVDESGPRWPDSIRMRFSHRPEIGLNGTDMKWNVMKLIKQKKSKINQIKSRKKKSLAQFKLIWIVVDRLKGNWMRQCGFINRCLLVKGGSRIFHCIDQFDYFLWPFLGVWWWMEERRSLIWRLIRVRVGNGVLECVSAWPAASAADDQWGGSCQLANSVRSFVITGWAEIELN